MNTSENLEKILADAHGRPFLYRMSGCGFQQALAECSRNQSQKDQELRLANMLRQASGQCRRYGREIANAVDRIYRQTYWQRMPEDVRLATMLEF